MLKTRNDHLKKTALPAFISGLFGVTEPAIYGVTLPKKLPFIITCVGGAAGGIFAGITHAQRFMMGGMGLFALPCYIDPNPGGAGMTNVILVSIAAVIASVISFALVWFTYKEDAPKK